MDTYGSNTSNHAVTDYTNIHNWKFSSLTYAFTAWPRSPFAFCLKTLLLFIPGYILRIQATTQVFHRPQGPWSIGFFLRDLSDENEIQNLCHMSQCTSKWTCTWKMESLSAIRKVQICDVKTPSTNIQDSGLLAGGTKYLQVLLLIRLRVLARFRNWIQWKFLLHCMDWDAEFLSARTNSHSCCRGLRRCRAATTTSGARRALQKTETKHDESRCQE